MPSLMLTAGVQFSQNVSDTQWVGQVTDSTNHYVFGHLDQTTVALTGRFNYRKFSRVLGLGNQLLKAPERASDKDIAAKRRGD